MLIEFLCLGHAGRPLPQHGLRHRFALRCEQHHHKPYILYVPVSYSPHSMLSELQAETGPVSTLCSTPLAVPATVSVSSYLLSTLGQHSRQFQTT